jgi:hypothetical protein
MTRKNNMLDIVMRTCSRKESQVHGTERIHSKEEILLKCLKALLKSIHNVNDPDNIKLIIVDDHSDPYIVERLREACDKFIALTDTTGNSASLHMVYDYAIENCEDLIYFLEDDYLHELSAIKEMIEFYYEAKAKLENKEVAIYPMDCNDRYRPQYLRPSFIVPGEFRYWRTTDSTTGTCLISKELFRKTYNIFKQFADYGINPQVHEENTINTIWRDSVHGAVCFSPIPTLAYHLQLESHLPLYTNYKTLWDSLEIEYINDSVIINERKIDKIGALLNIPFIMRLIRMNETTEGGLFYNANIPAMDAQLEFLYDVLNEVRPRNIIEIGTHQGVFDYFCLAIDPDVRITTFDVNPISERCVEEINIHFNFPENQITFVLGDSVETFTNYETPADLIYVDGSHSERVCLSDLENAARLDISHILVDDYRDRYTNDVKNSVKKFLEQHPEYKYDSESNLVDDRGIVYLKRFDL